MTLLIRCPRNNLSERQYIYDVILREYLGLSVELAPEERRDVRIELRDEGVGHLTISDVFLQLPWLDENSLPKLPLRQWEVPEELRGTPLAESALPLLYGEPTCELGQRHISLGADLFGGCLFMLTRYEEALIQGTDRHGRFPSRASIATQSGLNQRPLVNEYVEVLWSCLHRIWPRLNRSRRDFRMLVTCDVDNPLTCWARNPLKTIRRMSRAVIKERSIRTATAALQLHFQHRRKAYHHDPNMTFPWILDQCERAGVSATFYFICGHSSSAYDGCYRLEEPFIRSLLKQIHKRGHQIGLHGSYESFRDRGQLADELSRLRKVLLEEGIDQPDIGARQHYLRWRTPDTARFLAEAGVAHDSTLGFADLAGFRCGTCYEYPLYDIKERRPLPLRERPLIVMEQSVISPIYMNLGHTAKAVTVMLHFKETCKRFHGDFVLLWHNSSLATHWERETYLTLLND